MKVKCLGLFYLFLFLTVRDWEENHCTSIYARNEGFYILLEFS